MRLFTAILLTTGLIISAAAHAAEPVKLALTIRNHVFEPAELRAPTNTPIEITVTNADPTAEEFESKVLKIEKIIAGGRSALVRVLPQAPGQYRFVGEYHETSAKGVLIITPAP
jgi:plastocyanin